MNIGILAHVDAGKTTLSEALLYKTGKIRSLGRVDHQDAFLDTDAMEKERGITIFSKEARIQTDEVSVTLLDTPGHVDFSSEMERTLQVMDYAILVISATDGVQGHTRTLWRLLKHYEVPVFLFVNKMDLDGANREGILAQLKKELSDSCVDFSLWKPDSASMEEELSENIALCGEQLLEAYMETGEIPGDLVAEAIRGRKLIPCFFGSALKLEGVWELWQGICAFCREKTYPAEFAARVYKIGRDERGVRLTFLKLMGGRLQNRDKVTYGEYVEKVDQIRLYSGSRYETCDCLTAGQVAAVTGLSHTYPGQGLGALESDNMPVLEPVLNYQMILPPEVNPAEFCKNLRLLEEENPQLYVVWKEELKEIHVQLMGQVQMEVLTREIKDRFGVVVRFGPGSIVYKETIAEPVEGIGHFEPLRHYAEVHLLLSPGEPGSGITVDSACSEDVLDKNWQRLIATHVGEREHKGVLTGSGLTDVKVTILTGRAHPKHTEGGDFRQATYRAIRQGLKSTRCVLLEPFYSFTLQVPVENVGRAMTDLEQRSGKMEAPQFHTAGDREMAVITGRAPVSTMQDYIREVHAYTKGVGNLALELAGYDVCHNAKEVIEARGYDSELDFRNPTGSVFCAHGSGFVVPWDEVDSYMHLPRVFHGDTDRETLLAFGLAQKDGFSYDSDGNGFGPGDLAGRKSTSWEKTIASMSEVELDAELADVYAREFGMSKSDMEEQERRKWRKPKEQPVSHVKYDKKGNPIYPKAKKQENILIVDGYNIIFAWPELKALFAANMDSARDALKDTLCNYQGYKGIRVMLVFDAYKVKGGAGKRETYQNIEVIYTGEDETADAFIERTVHDMADSCKLTVATSDGLEQQTVMSLGALRMSARELKEEIERTTQEGYASYQEQK